MIGSSHLVLSTSVQRDWLKNSLMVVGASVLIALSAQISIPLFFTPIPFAAHAQVVLLLSVLLGSRRAVAAVSLYLMQGMMGLPVFAMGSSGLLTLTGPRGGYLLGYLFAAFITGWIAERLKKRNAYTTFGAMATGNMIIFLFGAVWLAHFVGWKGSWMLGVLPFLAGDLLKLLIATRGLKACRYF